MFDLAMISSMCVAIAGAPARPDTPPATRKERPPVRSAAGTSAEHPAPVASFERLIADLGSSTYRVREHATERLKEAGSAAFDALREAYQAVDSLEMRLRIQRIVEHIYFWERVLGRHGFLGISLSLIELERGRAAVEVREVLKGTSAERAGLQKSDLIVAIDGDLIEYALPPEPPFSKRIGSTKPGTPIKLSILRDGKRIEVPVILGHRPPENYQRREQKLQYEQVSRSFATWWGENFSTPPASEPPSPAP